MSTVYAGSETFPTSATIPDDGDDLTAASADVPFEALLDRTEWLKTHGILAAYQSAGAEGGILFTWTSTATVEGPGVVTVPNCRVGDVVLVTAYCQVGATNEDAYITLFGRQGSGSTSRSNGTLALVNSGKNLTITFTMLWTVADAGDQNFAIYGAMNAAGGGKLATLIAYNFTALHMRF